VTLAVTSEGVLEVSGVVPKLGDKLNIHETLTDLPQSAMVVNRIRVEPPRRSDTAIERDVRKALRSDDLLRTFKIDAETRNQKVYLTGTVPTPMMEQAALRTASDVRGVRDVIVSQLRIH
jgi:osmotically-inducible protein OsmY